MSDAMGFHTPHVFLDSLDAAKAERARMAAAFAEAKESITGILSVLMQNGELIFPCETDHSGHHLPSIVWRGTDRAASDKTKVRLTLVVTANPERGEYGVPGNGGDFALLFKVSDRSFYAAQLLHDEYRLDRPGAYTNLVADFGKFYGVYFNTGNAPTLPDDLAPVFNPRRDKAFGDANPR